MSAFKRLAVWVAVLALYVYGVILSSQSPSDGAIAFALSLWPIMVAELSRSDESKAVYVSMVLPLWGLGFIYFFQAAVGDPAPGLLPEDAVSAHVLFTTSTAFFPGGLLAGFTLKRMVVPKEFQRDYALEIFLLSPWIALYLMLFVVSRFF